ncbi:MAG TPA: hypothetical protein VGG66_11340, partial [Rhizomicrobium sp.]
MRDAVCAVAEAWHAWRHEALSQHRLCFPQTSKWPMAPEWVRLVDRMAAGRKTRSLERSDSLNRA